MHLIIRVTMLVASLVLFLTACDKTDSISSYEEGKASVLSVSTTTVAPMAADSLKPVLTLNWTYPDYATDSANIKYRIEIDAKDNNFKNPYVKEVTKDLSTTFIAKELNDMLLSRGYAFNVPVDMDVRLITSYANNNERIIANTITIKMTPYKVPPKVALPSANRLFITGGDFGWSNTNPMPAYQELTRLDETTWGGIFTFKGGESYLLLAAQGGWDDKYGALDGNNSNNVEGDSFKSGGGDLKSPADPGNYKLIVDFQAGTFTVTKLSNGAPANLYITGDATASDWTNSPPATQKFTQLSNGFFEITTALVPGKLYKFLSTPGQWQPQYGSAANNGGALSNDTNDPPAISSPAAAGNYKITVNFITNSYTIVKV
jgi:hypothetical protein